MRNERFSEHELDLLTAGVDGELPRRDAAELRALLKSRPDAVSLFQQFKSDASSLRELPKPAAPKGMASAILARLPVTAPTRPTSDRRRVWLPAAVAACLLFTVCSGSYLFFNVRGQRAVAQGVRDQLPALAPNVAATEPDQDSVVLAKAKPGPRVPQQNGKPGPEAQPLDTNSLAQTPKAPELAPAPRAVPVDALGAGILDHIKPLISAEIHLNAMFDAADFGTKDVQASLLKELNRDPAFRLDLFGKTPAAGYDALQKAAKAVGIAVMVDAKTQDLLNRKVPVNLAMYTEALTPAEVAALLAELAKQVKATNPHAIGRTHLIPAGAVEARDARELLGVDLQLLKTPRVGQANDPKPLSADTLTKVTGAVKKNDKPALVLAYLPSQMRTPPSQSKEINDFLNRKGDRRPGTVAMLFVVR